MCRSIHRLYNIDPPVTDDEIVAAARQFVRKISGAGKPSQANLDAIERAVHDVAHVSMRLLSELVSTAPPRDRTLERTRRRDRFPGSPGLRPQGS
jgi:hypothetical protein